LVKLFVLIGVEQSKFRAIVAMPGMFRLQVLRYMEIMEFNSHLMSR